MKKLTFFFYKNGKYKFAIPTLMVGFILQYILIAYFLPEFLSYSDGLKNPDQLFNYGLDYLDALYRNLGFEGRKFYVYMLYADFGYATISAFGYSLLLAALSKQRKWFILLPLLLSLFDISENILQIILMSQYPTLSTSLTTMASISTSAKMIVSMITILLIIFYCIYNIFQWAIRRWGQKKSKV